MSYFDWCFREIIVVIRRKDWGIRKVMGWFLNSFCRIWVGVKDGGCNGGGSGGYYVKDL